MGSSDQVRQALGVTRDETLGPDSVDWLGVPMVEEGVVRGAVVVQSYDPEWRYTEEDCALLGYVAQHILTNRKSTRLNSSHVKISYAVFCLKKKTTTKL